MEKVTVVVVVAVVIDTREGRGHPKIFAFMPIPSNSLRNIVPHKFFQGSLSVVTKIPQDEAKEKYEVPVLDICHILVL